MIDNESPHDLRRIRHEAAAIGKGLALLPGHIKIRLVDECSGTNAYVALACELAFCQSVQFPVEKSKEFTGGSFVTKFRQGDEGPVVGLFVSMLPESGTQPLAVLSNSQDREDRSRSEVRYQTRQANDPWRKRDHT